MASKNIHPLTASLQNFSQSPVLSNPQPSLSMSQLNLNKCPFCPRRFNSSHLLNLHLNDESSCARALQQQFQSQQPLNLPRPEVSKKPEAMESSFECPMCQTCYMSKALMLAHVHYFHPRQRSAETTGAFSQLRVNGKHFPREFLVHDLVGATAKQ